MFIFEARGSSLGGQGAKMSLRCSRSTGGLSCTQVRICHGKSGITILRIDNRYSRKSVAYITRAGQAREILDEDSPWFKSHLHAPIDDGPMDLFVKSAHVLRRVRHGEYLTRTGRCLVRASSFTAGSDVCIRSGRACVLAQGDSVTPRPVGHVQNRD